MEKRGGGQGGGRANPPPNTAPAVLWEEWPNIRNVWFKGKWGDEFLFAVLAEEWRGWWAARKLLPRRQSNVSTPTNPEPHMPLHTHPDLDEQELDKPAIRGTDEDEEDDEEDDDLDEDELDDDEDDLDDEEDDEDDEDDEE